MAGFDLAGALKDVSRVDHMQVQQIPIACILSNEKNFYHVDSTEQDLAESIQVVGLLEPLGVVPVGPIMYRLISGHRRFKAIRYLCTSGPEGREKWKTVPCIVYEKPEDADREILMVIHANAQRVKTPQEIAREAKEVTEILTRMKAAGAELPGRMRDRVAEALKISGARLARIQAIDSNLKTRCWMNAWANQKIGETVAYAISQLDGPEQERLWNHYSSAGISLKQITEKSIRQNVERWNSKTAKAKAEAPAVAAEEKTAKVPEPWKPMWYTGLPLSEGTYWCKVKIGKEIRLCVLRRRRGEWMFQSIDAKVDSPVLGWWPLPGE